MDAVTEQKQQMNCCGICVVIILSTRDDLMSPHPNGEYSVLEIQAARAGNGGVVSQACSNGSEAREDGNIVTAIELFRLVNGVLSLGLGNIRQWAFVSCAQLSAFWDASIDALRPSFQGSAVAGYILN